MKKQINFPELQKVSLGDTMPLLIFLYGDVGAGKTTLSTSLIRNMLKNQDIEVTSPTYTYYQKYKHIVHFDLYRLKNYDEFISIGGEEILDNNEGIILIEWPEILEPYYIPDFKIKLEYTGDDTMRTIDILKPEDPGF